MSPSPGRHWNSWDGTCPATYVHLPTGLTLRFSTFSAREGRLARPGPGSDVELLDHTSDGSYTHLTVGAGGSTVDIEFAKSRADHLVGRVHVQETAEWALRFWVCLEIGFTEVRHGPPALTEDPPFVRVEQPDDPYNGAPRVVTRYRNLWQAIAVDSRPTFASGYADPDQLREELESRGYYAPHAAPEHPAWAVLRFNGQANETVHFAVAAAHDRAKAVASADRLVLQAAKAIIQKGDRARSGSEAERAIRDVMAWNTIWDVANQRPMTVLTRNWLGVKFGGWGVWLDDVLFHALIAGHAGDAETARANLDAALTTVTPDGNLPCLRTAYEEWVDRSQPPIAGYVLSELVRLTGDRTLLSKHLDTVLRAHDWWFEHRDGNGNGLISFGSTPTGTGAFVHTKQAALDEASMDNLPAFDEATFDPETHTLDLVEPGLNSLLALEAEVLADLLQSVGHPDADRVRARGKALAEKIHTELWDDERGCFGGRLRDGTFVRSLAPTSFYPWLCGAADAVQTERMLAMLRDENAFWGKRVLPASTIDDPASADDVYWRGRIWPPLVWWTWQGLRRAGRDAEADEVRQRAWAMFLDGWRERRCQENYHANDPGRDHNPDSDSFYGWGALLPLMMVISERLEEGA